MMVICQQPRQHPRVWETHWSDTGSPLIGKHVARYFNEQGVHLDYRPENAPYSGFIPGHIKWWARSDTGRIEDDYYLAELANGTYVELTFYQAMGGMQLSVEADDPIAPAWLVKAQAQAEKARNERRLTKRQLEQLEDNLKTDETLAPAEGEEAAALIQSAAPPFKAGRFIKLGVTTEELERA